MGNRDDEYDYLFKGKVRHDLFFHPSAPVSTRFNGQVISFGVCCRVSLVEFSREFGEKSCHFGFGKCYPSSKAECETNSGKRTENTKRTENIGSDDDSV
jgi:hypothetical protein